MGPKQAAIIYAKFMSGDPVSAKDLAAAESIIGENLAAVRSDSNRRTMPTGIPTNVD